MHVRLILLYGRRFVKITTGTTAAAAVKRSLVAEPWLINYTKYSTAVPQSTKYFVRNRSFSERASTFLSVFPEQYV